MIGRKPNKPIPTLKIKNLYEVLESYTYEERMQVFGLNPDRADVIIPASKILLSVLKKAEIEKVLIPQIGLSDGIVHLLYEKHLEKKAEKV